MTAEERIRWEKLEQDAIAESMRVQSILDAVTIRAEIAQQQLRAVMAEARTAIEGAQS